MDAVSSGYQQEPHQWRLRSLSAGAKMWCGSTSGFMGAFLFAYFYLLALDPNHSWKIGKNVNPSGGLGVAIMAVFVLSGLLLWLGSRRPADEITTGVVAIVLAVVGIALQFVDYGVLGFGPYRGGYASVFYGWTAVFTLGALGGI